MGALADSYYEYLIKEYVLTEGALDQYKDMYLAALQPVKDYLLFKPIVDDDPDILLSGSLIYPTGGQAYLIGEMEHLTCFIGGMIGLGAKVLGRPEDMKYAAKLTDGCFWSYNVTATGVGPEKFEVRVCEESKAPCSWWDKDVQKSLRSEKLRIQAAAKAANSSNVATLGGDAVAPAAPAPAEAEAEVELAAKEGQLFEQDGDNVKSDRSLQKRAVIGIPSQQQQGGNIVEDQGNEGHRGPPKVPNLKNAAVLGNEVNGISDSGSGSGSSSDKRTSGNGTRVNTARPPKKAPVVLPDRYLMSDTRYLLRPEAIESVFIMWRITGDDQWREKGWQMFEAVEKGTRTAFAHAAMNNVMDKNSGNFDYMESFWLAETLKYFYLLFSDPNLISLDEYVLNTEAHPLKRTPA